MQPQLRAVAIRSASQGTSRLAGTRGACSRLPWGRMKSPISAPTGTRRSGSRHDDVGLLEDQVVEELECSSLLGGQVGDENGGAGAYRGDPFEEPEEDLGRRLVGLPVVVAGERLVGGEEAGADVALYESVDHERQGADHAEGSDPARSLEEDRCDLVQALAPVHDAFDRGLRLVVTEDLGVGEGSEALDGSRDEDEAAGRSAGLLESSRVGLEGELEAPNRLVLGRFAAGRPAAASALLRPVHRHERLGELVEARFLPADEVLHGALGVVGALEVLLLQATEGLLEGLALLDPSPLEARALEFEERGRLDDKGTQRDRVLLLLLVLPVVDE